jgi:outer membrane lipoprotein carrier protein
VILKLITAFALSAQTAPKAADAVKVQEPLVTKLTTRYRQAKMVEMDVEKTVVSELVGKTTKYEGKIYLMGELFRFDTAAPERTEIIYDGKFLWTIQHPSVEFGGELIVSKQNMSAKSKSQIFLSSLLMRKDVRKHFDILSENKDELKKEAIILVKPLGQGMNVEQLELRIDTNEKKNLVREVSFNDEVGNKTTFLFPKVLFQDRKNNKLFQYKPAKGVKVLEL